MAVKLHRAGYEHARGLVEAGKVVTDDRSDWSKHQPSPADANGFIEEHGFAAYGKWHLGVDDDQPRETKGHYKFPYGDFEAIHRCAVLAAESRAAQNDYDAIKSAAAHLHGMLEASGVH
jgi:hypothetical protein